MHEHPAHLVVSLGAASVKFTTGDGKAVDVAMKADDVTLMPAGTHAGTNVGTNPVDVVIVEMKGEPGAASLPPTRPGLKSTVLLDNTRVRAVRASFEPTFNEPAGSTHDYDQVVVMLAPADVALTLEGKTVVELEAGRRALDWPRRGTRDARRQDGRRRPDHRGQVGRPPPERSRAGPWLRPRPARAGGREPGQPSWYTFARRGTSSPALGAVDEVLDEVARPTTVYPLGRAAQVRLECEQISQGVARLAALARATVGGASGG